MTDLLTLQRRVAAAVMQPLASGDHMRKSPESEAAELIKPNDRLSSFERLEIYNRQYWFRVLSCFADDFPGLRAIVGSRRFEQLSRKYLADCPSVSFTLRNLGSQLEQWLRDNPMYIAGVEQLALDMVRIEWAHVEAFDELSCPALTLADFEGEDEIQLRLQPYIRLLDLRHSVDDLVIAVRQYQGDSSTASNNARTQQLRRRVRRFSMPEPEPVYLAVHRFEDSVYYKRLQPEAFCLLSELGVGKSLDSAVETAFANSAIAEPDRLAAVKEWFANWAELGWFCRPGAALS